MLLSKKNKTLFDYNQLRSNCRKARESEDFELNNIGLTLYHTLNKMKEFDLKRKIREGQKARVLFLLDQPSKLSAISIYKNMLESKIFDPFIVLYNNLDEYFETDSVIYNNHKNGFEHLLKKGYKIFNGYDDKKNVIPIENFKPDIIFTNAPYLDYSHTPLTNTYMNLNYLVCYLPYHFGTINNYDYHYNNRIIVSCWKNFVSSREDYIEHLKYSKYCGSNAVMLGYPKLDDYAKPIEECKIHEKINNGKPIVIYAPHHSIGDNWRYVSLGTFHIYYKYFLNLAKNNTDINFVFKPHPDLSIKVVENGLMSIEEYQNYINEWDSLPNGLYVSDGDYIDLFRKADLLIQDCGSFIGEWLPTNKPCMFLIKPECDHDKFMEGFSTIGKKILNKYYLCHNKNEINKYFNMILIDKQDPLRNDRVGIIDEIYINIGCSGKKIVEYLETLLKD